MDIDGYIPAEKMAGYKKFDPLIAKLNFTGFGDMNITSAEIKDELNFKIQLSLASLGYKRKQNEDYVEWLKLGFIMPEKPMF
jgi:hypothetical protein